MNDSPSDDGKAEKRRIVVRRLGMQPYQPVVRAMQEFTATRTADTLDEIWVVQHPPVFTQGLAGKAEHLLDAGVIPVIQTDRGGQITYHGPGQLVLYLLLDMRRAGFWPRGLVTLIEEALIVLLAGRDIVASARADAPGVYVDGAKIASLGLRIRRGCCYHGLSLNVDMDLGPFRRINPCGLAGLAMTQVREQTSDFTMREIEDDLLHEVISRIGYTKTIYRGNLPEPTAEA